MIGTNKKDAADTVARILEDEQAGTLGTPADADADAVAAWLAERVPDAVTWEGWQAIDADESAAGEPQGRPRVKLVTLEELREAGRLTPRPLSTETKMSRRSADSKRYRRPKLVERVAQPVDRRRHVRGVDVVRGVGLVVLDGQAAGLEQLPRAAGEVDVHDRVVAAVGDERARAGAVGERRAASRRRSGRSPRRRGSRPARGGRGPRPSA